MMQASACALRSPPWRPCALLTSPPENRVNEIRSWTRRDAAEMYNVQQWGAGYFHVNEVGHVQVTPDGPDGPGVDLHDLVLDLRARGIGLPLLIRFSDILHSRVRTICSSFATAIREYGYKGTYRGVYPIKVNQQRHVVEEIVRFGRPYHFGLEAGCKPELLVALALQDNPERADHLQRLQGRRVHRDRAARAEARPHADHRRRPLPRARARDPGVASASASGRTSACAPSSRRAAPASGRSRAATARSSASPPPRSSSRVDRLRAAGMLDCLELLHFHIGSQITAIRAIKDAMREARRFYVELAAAGAGLKYIDVGGGLGVDYDGSQTNFDSSMNYTVQEYANDVVSAIQRGLRRARASRTPTSSPSPAARWSRTTRCSSSTCSASTRCAAGRPPRPRRRRRARGRSGAWPRPGAASSRKNVQESYHDALQLKDEATQPLQPRLPRPARSARASSSCSGAAARRSCKIMQRAGRTCPRSSRASRRAGRHLLRQLLGLPVGARPLGDRAALPDPADPPPRREADAPRRARRHHLRLRRQDRPLHRPARRQDARSSSIRTTASPTTSASSSSAPTRRSWATCTTCSATRTPCTCASRRTATSSSTWSRATR